MSRQRHASALMFLIAGVLFSATVGFAQIIGADPAACQGELSVCTHHMSTYSWVSLTEGNVAETYSAARVMSAFGPTLSLAVMVLKMRRPRALAKPQRRPMLAPWTPRPPPAFTSTPRSRPCARCR